MKRGRLVAIALGLMSAPAFSGCENGAAADLTIERLPDVSPQVPAVPTIPPPPYPVTYPDGSYSVYGVRRRESVTMNQTVTVSGYIVEIYQPPECPRGQTCTPAAPHIWIADSRSETESRNRLMIVGYAQNQEEVADAVAAARRGRVPPPEEGQIAVPSDFFVGNKVKVQGQFVRIAGSGFNVSEGLLDYRGHNTLEVTPEAREALGRAAGGEG
jgi:hypothetical protein